MAFRVRTPQQTFSDPWLHVEPNDCRQLPAEVALPLSITWDLDVIAAAIQDQVDDVVEPANVTLGTKWEWYEGQLYLPVAWRDAKGVGEALVLVRPLAQKGEFQLMIDVRVSGYLATGPKSALPC